MDGYRTASEAATKPSVDGFGDTMHFSEAATRPSVDAFGDRSTPAVRKAKDLVLDGGIETYSVVREQK